MNYTVKNEETTIATLIHLSVFSMFLVPLGNFIFPLILWLIRKDSPFVDHHGRQALNFQISMFLYMILLSGLALSAMVYMGMNLGMEGMDIFHQHPFPIKELSRALPFFLILVCIAMLGLGLFILLIFAVISASLKASEGEPYHYPLSLNFLGAKKFSSSNDQSKNEQFNNPQN